MRKQRKKYTAQEKIYVFIAKDFKEFIRIAGMTHAQTPHYYPQSNEKLERWQGTIESLRSLRFESRQNRT